MLSDHYCLYFLKKNGFDHFGHPITINIMFNALLINLFFRENVRLKFLCIPTSYINSINSHIAFLLKIIRNQ